MTNKIIIAILTLFAWCAAPCNLSAQTPAPKDFEIKPSGKPIRPHSPGFENEVTGSLYNGVLTLSFAEPEGMATVKLREAGVFTIYQGNHLTTAPITITMPETSLPTQIFITTQVGNSYEGWIE